MKLIDRSFNINIKQHLNLLKYLMFPDSVKGFFISSVVHTTLLSIFNYDLFSHTSSDSQFMLKSACLWGLNVAFAGTLKLLRNKKCQRTMELDDSRIISLAKKKSFTARQINTLQHPPRTRLTEDKSMKKERN